MVFNHKFALVAKVAWNEYIFN